MHRVTSRSDLAEGSVLAAVTDPLELENFLKKRTSWNKAPLYDLPHNKTTNPVLCLTFDDGFRDNLTEALPILERHQTPATIFVTTGFIDQVLEPLEFILSRMIARLTEIQILEFSWPTNFRRRLTGRSPLSTPGTGVAPLRSPEEYQRAWQIIQRPLKHGSLNARIRYLEELAELNGLSLPPPEPGLFLSWDEVRELDRHPLITIGAHSHTHPRFDLATPWQIYFEASKSKQRLEEELGHPVNLFAYPYGAQSYIAQKIVQLAGFHRAYTVISKPSVPSQKSKPMAIPRTDFRDV